MTIRRSPSLLPAGAPDEGNGQEAVASVEETETHVPSSHKNECRCSALRSPRNLVVCIDGTANQFSETNSNVVELYSRLVKGKDQLTYYNSGIGTFVKDSKSWKSWFSLRSWKQYFDHTGDKAVAWHFKKKVLSAYQWLSENYEDGDRIFLFGFSRGAYQARVIAGMIELVGLLHKGNNDQIPFAYELYLASIANELREDPKGSNTAKDLCKHFKRTLSRPNVKVHFIGAWDTVSSIGVFRGRNLPETTSGLNHVCAFRHALALDELRVKFLPEYANGGAGPKAKANHIKEVWFAGSHSDIGGGNMPNIKSNLFGPALRWMSYEAITWGLKMQHHQDDWSPIALTNSMTIFWKIFEYIPFSRLSYQGADGVERWPPHREAPRQVQKGQLIHQSVFEETPKDYRSKALICGEDIVWDKAALENRNMIENDPYAQVGDILNRIKELDLARSEIADADIGVLATFASTEIHRRSIIAVPNALEILINSLWAGCRRPVESLDLCRESIFALIKALNAFHLSPSLINRDLNLKHFAFISSLDTKSHPILEDVRQLLSSLGIDLFALVIGINEYKYEGPGICNLTDCVADADNIGTFLTSSVGVPANHIINLHNEQATRIDIMRELLRLATDDRISKNSSIVIYYAGHGARAEAPQERRFVEMIIPHDFNPTTNPGQNTPGIPDITMAALLDNLANEKGSNITFILDCCCCCNCPPTWEHPVGVRSIQVPVDYEFPLSPDDKVLYDSFRSGTARDFLDPTTVLSSHILLTACSDYKVEGVENAQGALTQALTKHLRARGSRNTHCGGITR